MTATLFPVLDWLYPACAIFGPLFLVVGIFNRTSSKRESRPKLTNAILVLGGVMVAFALLQKAPMGIPAHR